MYTTIFDFYFQKQTVNVNSFDENLIFNKAFL